MAQLTVNFSDINGDPQSEIINVPNLKVTRPIDVIQIIYNVDDSYKPQPSGGGGSTIWKMGKLVGGGDCTDTDSLFANGIIKDATVGLRTIDIDAERV